MGFSRASCSSTPCILASGGGGWSTAGRLAAADWIAARNLPTPAMRWHVDIQLDVRNEPAPHLFDLEKDSRFHVEIYTEEWGFFFCHGGHASWIRITDVPFAHGRDDFG